ncbi:MAG: type II secretion system F family protein, partial [Clostridia bacterium]|nr:type II secretion system F family protein [Clostridia bacterium]
RKKAADKRREIGGAMPAMITKTVLFLRAGLTVAESWRMISEKTGGVLGEEMRRTSEEIKNGASLQDAFTAFAVRCDEKTAARFSWLISRNLLKGDGGLSEVLADFGNEIWEERKALARERGGAASNALVLPLIIIFIGILIQIAVPLLGGNVL